MHIKIIHQTLLNIIRDRDYYQQELTEMRAEKDRLEFELDTAQEGVESDKNKGNT